jgi:signal transduction histidine kinase/DNA-binding response OmpR family regulator
MKNATDEHSKPARAADPKAGTGGPAHAPTEGAASLLLARGPDVRREGVRVVAGFALLFVVGVAALNVTLWHNAGKRIEEAAWRRLEAATDVRRTEVDHALDVFQREALSVAHDPFIVAAVTAVRPDAPAAARGPLLDELFRRAAEFEFGDVAVTDADGVTIADRESEPRPEDRADARAAKAAVSSRRPVWGGLESGRLVLAVPVANADLPVRALVFHADATRSLMPMLQDWPGFGTTGGAYLVRPLGTDVELLTRSPSAHGLAAGTRLPMNRREVVAAAMAATHVSSRVESSSGNGQPVWAVSRPLESAGWGLVGQADRSELMASMTSVRQLLLLLDFILFGVFLALVLVWRRSYTEGLARREVELTERHARRVQTILDTAFDAVFTFDRLGRVHSANRAAEALVGRPAGDILDQPIQRILTWTGAGRAGVPDPPGVSPRPLSLPQTGSVAAGTALLPGGAIPVEFSLGRSGEGEALLYTAIVRDVRERVEAERRIREFAEGLENSNRRLEEMNVQLEQSSRLKSEFLANTSHELRTPLNGMIGFLQLVLDGMCDSREEELDFLKQALQCSRHLLGLINDVLDIAKIEAGKLALDIGRLDLQQLFDEVYTVTHVQAAQKGLRLTFEDQSEGSVSARGDFGKIKQVLINLIGNSLKFTTKGEIRVRAKAHTDQGHLVIEVEDTGVGIAVERQKLVFEKFVQGDGSTTRRFGGTGLGLAISKSLVELMGGIIGIHSEGENRGTRVYFSLPLWRDDGSPAAPTTAAADVRVEGATGDPLVLVVEDDPVFRRFVTAVLQHGGYRTVEADTAESAWMLVRRLHPSVVMLDYALSCHDGASLRTGWDLAQRMASESETRHIPVVFVTGFDGELKQRLQATAFARRPEHLVKPVDARTLIAKIAELTSEITQRPVRVLMADDDPTVTAYVRKVLPAQRFLLEVANNGEECLHILRTQPNAFDVLLLDLMMPEVSGYDVLREMTLAGLYPNLPVMVLTNFPEPRNSEERRLLEQGLVLDVVAKTAVHENPQMLPHVLDWHLQVARGEAGDADEDGGTPERRAA